MNRMEFERQINTARDTIARHSVRIRELMAQRDEVARQTENARFEGNQKVTTFMLCLEPEAPDDFASPDAMEYQQRTLAVLSAEVQMAKQQARVLTAMVLGMQAASEQFIKAVEDA